MAWAYLNFTSIKMHLFSKRSIPYHNELSLSVVINADVKTIFISSSSCLLYLGYLVTSSGALPCQANVRQGILLVYVFNFPILFFIL